MEIKAKKSLGQNFLKDDAILQRIVENANLSADDVVIEIGPGHGALTELLAQKCKKVIAIELDNRLIEVLQKKFENQKNIEILHDDILKINLPKIVTDYELSVVGYKVIANLPYYITSPIIRLFLETQYSPKKMIFMVQREVAERICAKAGKMSILAVSVQYYAKPEYLFTVPKESFEPMPKVESAVIKIVRSSEFIVGSEEETKKFFRIVRAGFSAKRKTLENNLSNGLQKDKEEIEEKLIALGFSKNTRAQELRVKNWRKLSEIL